MKYSVRSLPEKDLRQLDPSKTKTVPYTRMRGTSLTDGENVSKDLLNPSTHTIGHAWGAYFERKTPSLRLKSS